MAIQKFAGIYFDKSMVNHGYEKGVYTVRTGGGSIRVPEGYAVQFSENEDGSGDKSRVLYAGEYEDLSFYPGVVGSGRFDVTVNEIKRAELATAINYVDAGTGTPYAVKYQIPPGVHDCSGNWWDNLFPNDAIDALIVPEGLTVKVYDRADQPYHLDFEGPVTVDLGTHKYKDKISKIEVIAEEWDVTGAEADWDHKNVLSSENMTVGEASIDNRKSSSTLSQEQSISVRKNRTYTSQWDVNGKISTTVSAGFKPFGIGVDANVTVEVGGGYGESYTDEIEQTYSASAQIETPAGVASRVLLKLDWEKFEVPMKRYIQNSRTGEVIEQTGKLLCGEGFNATLVGEDIS